LQKVNLSGSNIWDSTILLDTHKPETSNETKPADNSGIPGYSSDPTAVYPHRAESGEYAIWMISDKTGDCITGFSDTYGDTYIDRSS
jgi:hypothetical protein